MWSPSPFLSVVVHITQEANMNRITQAAFATIAAAVLGASTVGCSGGKGAAGSELDQFRYLVPNSAGSGWDTTARTAAKIMEDDDIVKRVDVFNVDGANGTVGLSRLTDDDGNGELVMQMGFGL